MASTPNVWLSYPTTVCVDVVNRKLEATEQPFLPCTHLHILMDDLDKQLLNISVP